LHFGFDERHNSVIAIANFQVLQLGPVYVVNERKQGAELRTARGKMAPHRCHGRVLGDHGH
jgi:hypothetical protein